MAAITIDADSFRPLYLVTWVGSPSDEEFERYLEAMRADMVRPDATRRILIQDSRRNLGPSAVQRRMQADWIKRNEALIRERTIAIVFINDSAVLRGMLTAILWFQPLPMPHHVCGTMQEALEHCEQKLKSEGFPMPRGAREVWLRR